MNGFGRDCEGGDFAGDSCGSLECATCTPGGPPGGWSAYIDARSKAEREARETEDRIRIMREREEPRLLVTIDGWGMQFLEITGVGSINGKPYVEVNSYYIELKTGRNPMPRVWLGTMPLSWGKEYYRADICKSVRRLYRWQS